MAQFRVCLVQIGTLTLSDDVRTNSSRGSIPECMQDNSWN